MDETADAVVAIQVPLGILGVMVKPRSCGKPTLNGTPCHNGSGCRIRHRATMTAAQEALSREAASAARDAVSAANQGPQRSLIDDVDRAQLLGALQATIGDCEAEIEALEEKHGGKRSELVVQSVAGNAAVNVVKRDPRWNLSARERDLVVSTWEKWHRLPTLEELDERDEYTRIMEDIDSEDERHDAIRDLRLSDPDELRYHEIFLRESRERWY